jgi:hypothetical protein
MSEEENATNDETHMSEEQAAVKIQAQYRGFRTRKWLTEVGTKS